MVCLYIPHVPFGVKVDTFSPASERTISPTGLSFCLLFMMNNDVMMYVDVFRAQLLEKYFQQLDEIKTLKEQVRYKEKKIRRLEDQLRIFSRTTTTPSAS